MQCPGYDDCWPSDEAVPRMEKILKEAGYPYRYKATVYEKGSHLLCGDLSGSPEYLKSMKKILQAEYVDQDACNKGRNDSMKEALDFLEGWKEWMKALAIPELLIGWPFVVCPLVGFIVAGLSTWIY